MRLSDKTTFMTDMNAIDSARRVLNNEAEALVKLAEALDDNFTKAVDAVHAMKNAPQPGRFIIAGIGKSGHVARKIAATLASTGTPAYFVHPGEASHGDMGMITRQDVVMMLSNSGENPELSDLIHYTRRYDITLIGMTSNPASSLGKHCDIPLLIPKMPEACPNGLAPTTSTTMMLAFGDALAVALLEKMGLTPDQYKVFHPGGKLGQKLMKVSELMVPYDDLPILDAAATMDKALLELSGKNLGCVLISNDGKAVDGIITDGDLKRHMGPDLLQKTVADVMTADPKKIGADALAVSALDQMTKVKGSYITSLIAVDADGNLKGLIRLQDCLQAGLA